MNIKGQGALEYLLLIGGAVLVAAIVIALVTGIPTGTPNPQNDVFCANKINFGECDGILGIESVTVGTWSGVGMCCGQTSIGTPAVDQTDFAYCRWQQLNPPAVCP